MLILAGWIGLFPRFLGDTPEHTNPAFSSTERWILATFLIVAFFTIMAVVFVLVAS